MENAYLKKAKKFFDEVGIYIDFSECKEATSLNNARLGDFIKEELDGKIISARIVAIFTNIKNAESYLDLTIGIDENNNDCYFFVSEETKEISAYDFSLN